MTDKQIFWFEVLSGGTLLVIVTWCLAVWKSRHVRQPRFEELARIQENVSFSLGGALAVLMLVLFNVAMPLLVFAALEVPSIGPAMAAAWIAGNVLGGTGAVIGRRRAYRIIRVMPVRSSSSAPTREEPPIVPAGLGNPTVPVGSL